MKTIRVFLLISGLLLTTTHLQARAFRIWSYSELTAAADVVVIAKPLSNVDTEDLFNKLYGYIGVNTGFQIKDTIKGDVEGKKFTVIHFKNNPQSAHADGMMVVGFRLEEISFDGKFQRQNKSIAPTTAKVQIPSPEYLLFLKRRTDGRYEPVTGQMEAALSVKEVNEPFPFMD